MKYPLDYIPLVIVNNNTNYNLNINTIDPRHLILYLISDNKFKIQINADIIFPDYKINIPKVYNYDILFNLLVILMSIINIMGVYCIMSLIKKEIYLSSAISLQNFSVNMIIHYHLLFSFLKIFLNIYKNNIYRKMIYGIGSLFLLINFLFFDYRFYLKFWQIKVHSVNTCLYRKITFKFFLYISVLFIGFILTYSSQRAKIHIIMITLSMWTPQIIHNIITNNRYIVPLFYIITYTIDKILYFIFFNSIYERKTSLLLFIILGIYTVLTIVILYLQTYLGARFMLPFKYKKKDLILYKSKNEIFLEKPETQNEDCNICLSSLFGMENEGDIETKNNNELNNNELNINEIENDGNITSKDSITTSINKFATDFDKNIIQDINSISNSENNIYVNKIILNNKKIKRNKKKSCYIWNCLKQVGKFIKFVLIEILFRFYKAKPIFYKPYILLQCGHIFHSVCIESWFGVKKECPICRAPIYL